MIIILEVPETTGKTLQALAFLTGRKIAEIAASELEGTLMLPSENPYELLDLVLEVHCDNPAERAAAVERFQRYCQLEGINVPDYEIDAALAEANGEIERGQGKLLAEAGRIMAQRPPAPG